MLMCHNSEIINQKPVKLHITFDIRVQKSNMIDQSENTERQKQRKTHTQKNLFCNDFSVLWRITHQYPIATDVC